MPSRGNLYPTSPFDDEDNATLIRRKNAEAQRQYRERKKEQEELLLAENAKLKEENVFLRARLERLEARRKGSSFVGQNSPLNSYPNTWPWVSNQGNPLETPKLSPVFQSSLQTIKSEADIVDLLRGSFDSQSLGRYHKIFPDSRSQERRTVYQPRIVRQGSTLRAPKSSFCGNYEDEENEVILYSV